MGPDPDKIKALEEKMTRLGIRQNEITIRFIKSSGRGGQKVNKSSSAVFLRHEPTGLTVKCGKHRSQHLNRFLALRALVEKLDTRLNGIPDRESERFDRMKKQKRRRKKRARQKILADAQPLAGDPRPKESTAGPATNRPDE